MGRSVVVEMNPYTRTGARALDSRAASYAGAIETSQERPATQAEDWSLACCLWPVLVEIERVFLWTAKADLLLKADLPVAVYDLAVDVLHPAPRQERNVNPAPRNGARPWNLAGFQNRDALVAGLRAEGYDGPTSYQMPRLWALLNGLGDGLAG